MSRENILHMWCNKGVCYLRTNHFQLTLPMLYKVKQRRIDAGSYAE